MRDELQTICLPICQNGQPFEDFWNSKVWQNGGAKVTKAALRFT